MPKDKLFDENVVLQKATGLFWNKGYNGTSMDELTKATGLSRSSIYNAFGDKHALFMRCLDYYLEWQQRDLMQAVEKIPAPLKKIKAAFKHIVEVILSDAQRNGCLAVNSTTELVNIDPEVASILVQNMSGMEQLFQEWIKAAQQQGEIHPSFSAQAIARHLFNSYVGLRVSGQTKPERKGMV